MAEISRGLQHQFALMIGNIPQEIRKAIDAAELEDRVVQAAELIRKSQAARTPGERKQLGEQAQRILQARPRAQTEAIVVAKMAKSKVIGNRDQADELVRQAREELLAHPPAVRRGAPVAKAKAAAKPDEDQLMAIYNQAGELTHVAYPRDMTPVIPQPAAQARDKGPVEAGGATGTGAPRRPGPAEPLPGDLPDRQVVKAKAPAAAKLTAAEQLIKSYGPGWMAVYDWRGRLAGAVRRSHVAPMMGGQVLKGAAGESRANVYDAKRQRVGTAPLSQIVQLADLLGDRRR